MDIRFHEKLYSNDMSPKKLALIKKKIYRKSPKRKLFLVTLPVGGQGLLEVYWYPEILQPFYQRMDTEMVVVGLAKSRAEAFNLIVKIVEDTGVPDGEIPIAEFFKEQGK